MSDVECTPPLVVKVGKATRKQIKKLGSGEGRLARKVNDAVEAVRAELGAEAEGKILVPVAVIIRRTERRRRGGALNLFGL